jgi:hypothetical protein
MYVFCNVRTHIIALIRAMYVIYYVSMLRCWQLVWILVKTNHPCLRVVHHTGGVMPTD